MTKNRNIIAATVFVFSLLVTLVDAFLHPDYFTKIPIKIVFFLLLPLLFFVINKDDFGDFKSLFAFKRRGLLKAFVLGLLVYAIIVGGYFALRTVIDFSNVTTSLTGNMGITAENFLYVSLYLSIINSFLEEFFFRGFGFVTLKKYSGGTVAHVFSSVMFAFYHAGMMWGMFDIFTLMLLFTGLVVGGLIFNYLNDSSKTVYPSWFVHMFANFGINTVGFILFGVV